MINRLKSLFSKEIEVPIEKDKILDLVNGIILALDKKGRILYINDKGCEILGYSKKEILGKSWFKNFLPKKIKKEVLKVFDNIIKGNLEPVKHFENPIFTRKREELMISWNNTYLKNEKGEIYGILTSGQDITEERKAKQELKDKEAKYRGFVENSNDITYSTDSRKVITYISPNVSLLGYTSEEVIGKKIEDFIHKDDLKNLVFDLKNTLKSNNKKITNFRIKDKKGKYHFIEETGNPIIENGKNVGTIGSLRDVTDKKAYEKDLLKFKLGLEKSPSAIFITEPDGTINYANSAFTRIYGFSQKETIGKKPNILKSGIMSQKDYKNFWSTLLSKQAINGEIINKRKDGKIITISGSVNPIIDDDKILGFLSIHTDITEKKESEERMKEQNTYLKTIIDSFPSPLYIIDADNYDIVLTNKSLNIEKGKKVKCYKQTHRRNTPCDGKNDICPLTEIKKTKKPFIVEHTHFDNEGIPRLYQVRAYPILNSKNEVTHIIETSIDITKDKEYQKNIEESEKKFRTLFDNANDLIQNIDSNGNIKFVNKKWMETLGFNEDEVKNINIFSIIKEDNRDHCKKIFHNLISGASSEDIEVVMISKSGKEITLEGNANQIRTDNKIETIGIFRDVTEKKNIEKELNESRKQLEEKVKNLERFNKVVIDRELKMIELKKEIKKLKGK